MVVVTPIKDYVMSPSMGPLSGWWFGLLNDLLFMVPPRPRDLSNWNRPGWLRKFSISPDEKALRGPIVRPLRLVAINDVFNNLRLRKGNTRESPGPNLVDVYRRGVYEKNLKE